jgi:DNA-binding XRE family transcriptional regulator
MKSAYRVSERGVMFMRVNIEAERARLQMTKTDMCKELGITLKTYNEYIRGSVVPSTVLEKLRNLTGRSVDYLLGLTDVVG